MTLLRAILWWIACFLAAVLCGLILAGCFSTPYWVLDSDPVPIRAIIHVDAVICGGATSQDYYGCADRETGIIQISKQHPYPECSEMHERKHMAGWSHPENAPLARAFDCGDGRIYPFPIGW